MTYRPLWEPTWATPTGWRSTRPGSTCSLRPLVITSGSTWTVNGPLPGPFGTTIAHGYLTLSLTNKMLPDLIRVDGISMGINYGTEKVRFPSPVLVDSRVRGGAELISVDEVSGGYQAVIRVTVEVEDLSLIHI